MRVIAYLHYLPPHRFTGGELMTADLLSHLIECGHEVDVYAQYVPRAYEYRGIPVHPGAPDPWVAQSYDIFMTHPEIRTMAWSSVRGMPYAAVVHNLNPLTMRSLDRQPPTLTIANSQWTCDHLPDGVRDTAHILHPPVADATPVVSGRAWTMVNHSPEKGGGILDTIARRNPDLRFQAVVGGHGEQVRGLPANVRVIRPTHDMDTVYADARGLLFPSRSETYGKAVAEALVRGIPVVASDLPGIREAGGDAPVYCEVGDVDQFDDAVRRLESRPVHKCVSRAALDRGKFLVERSARDLDRWVDLLEGIKPAQEKARWVF